MWWAMAAFVLIGTTLTMQRPVNIALSRELGGPVSATAVAFGVGFGILMAIALVQGSTAMLEVPPLPSWIPALACLAAWYVLNRIWGVSTLGVLALLASVILGQMTAAMLMDSTGALGVEVREVTPKRVAAAALVMAGLILSRA